MIERFLEAEFISHDVPVRAGDYDAGSEHGQCDLVIEAPETVIFAEVKKKTLTRWAKAGSDAHLLLDFAGSLLAARRRPDGMRCGWAAITTCLTSAASRIGS